MIAAFNSSPLIFLSKLKVIDQSLKLFSKVTVSSYVQNEIFKKEDIASENLKALITSNNVMIVKAKNLRMLKALCRKLGRGESETIVAALENLADIVVLDDHVARLEAARMGLSVKGTLGIIRSIASSRKSLLNILEMRRLLSKKLMQCS